MNFSCTAWAAAARPRLRSSLLRNAKTGICDANESLPPPLTRNPSNFLPRAFWLFGLEHVLIFVASSSERRHQLCPDRFTRVLWVDAANRNTIEQSYMDIARAHRVEDAAAIGGSGRNEHQHFSVHEALALFASLDEEWLLLIDGADELEAIAGLWPPGHKGNVLYTSRNLHLRNIRAQAVCEVAEMDEAEAVQLLLDAARLDAASKALWAPACSIVAELGYLALAIDQAGAYIARGECRIDDFVETLKRHRGDLFQVDAYKGASSYERAVYATWELSYNSIERQAGDDLDGQSPDAQVAHNALQLLNMLAYFHYKTVMEDVFRFAAENPMRGYSYGRLIDPEGVLGQSVNLPNNLLPLGPDRAWESCPFRKAVALLCNYSLINQWQQDASISMHRLVHGWAFDRMPTEIRRTHLLRATATIAGSVRLDDSLDAYICRRNLLPHILSCFDQAQVDKLEAFGRTAEILVIASVMCEAGHEDRFAIPFEKAFATMKRLLGPEHLHLLEDLAILAELMHHQGQDDEAYATIQQAYNLSNRLLGPDHQVTQHHLRHVARAIIRRGQEREGERLLQQLYDAQKSAFGLENSETLDTMRELADAIREQGRSAEAEALLKQTYDTSTAALGTQHPKTLGSLNSLAVLISLQGRLAEAEQLFKQLCDAYHAIMGPLHPSTLNSKIYLAGVTCQQGRYVEAERLFMQALDGQKSFLDSEHSEVLCMMEMLGALLLVQERCAEAVELLSKVLEGRKRAPNPDLPLMLRTMDFLVPALRKQE